MDSTTSDQHMEHAVASNVVCIPQRIYQLQEGISRRPITVCIRNIWDIKNHGMDNAETYTGFLCYDHHGHLLEGRLTGNLWSANPKYLTEGDVYEISGFYVLHNPRQRKLTQLPYYILIDQNTIVSNVTGIGPIFPVHNLSPQSYESLLRLATTPTYLPDVVGQIRLMQNLDPFHPKDNTELTVGLLLNRSTMVKLKLWDKQAADFSVLQSKKNMKFKVVIITSIIPKIFEGKLRLNSSPATMFYFNKSIDYIKHFKGRIRNKKKA